MSDRTHPAGPADISVIIVNYGTADLAVDAVQSVLDHHHSGWHVDIHLVDNASPGSDREIFEAKMQDPAWQTRVTFYPEDTNHGFGRGNNLVLRVLEARAHPPRYVFLLNPDARLGNEALAMLAHFLDATPDAGFAGAAISRPETGPVCAAFRFPGFISECTQMLGIGPIFRFFGRWQVALPSDHPKGQVGWVSGAAVMARFQALREIGFFDPTFFLYFEETDLMRRGGKAGWQTWYVPEARVMHIEGAATGVRSDDARHPPRPAYWYQSWGHYFHNAKGKLGAAALVGLVLLASGLRLVQMKLRGKPAVLPANFFPDFWRNAARPLLTGRSPIALGKNVSEK